MNQKAAASDRALMDQEHLGLAKLIDTLQATINQGHQRDMSDEIEQGKAAFLSRLDEHLETERRIMMATGFPLTFSHLEAHESFRDQVKAILSSIDSVIIDNANVSKLLKRIHDHHVKHFDQILMFYLADKYSLELVDDGLGI